MTRRFQVVQVEEPDVPKAIRMMRGIASMLEKHHRVQVLDEGIEAAVSLSARYIPAAPAAGQVGQRPGYRLCAGVDQPARGPGRGR